mgnify:CR=1 FL=1
MRVKMCTHTDGRRMTTINVYRNKVKKSTKTCDVKTFGCARQLSSSLATSNCSTLPKCRDIFLRPNIGRYQVPGMVST